MLLLTLFSALRSLGQSKPVSTEAFDVTSVKPSASSVSQGGIRRLDVGILSVFGMTLKDILVLSLHVRPYQILGGPEWASKDRFDVTGKDLDENGSRPKKFDEKTWSAAMDRNDEKMVSLLEERFSLKTHYETKVMPVLLLVRGKNTKFVQVPCSSTYRLQHGWVQGDIHMASLASLLKGDLGRAVEDKTGLPDCYHLEARWTTDPDNTSLPQIPTALRDLGLRLQKSSGDVDVLVIDHVERPKPD